jgi:hypothetical protein
MRPQVAAMAGKRPLPRKPGDSLVAWLPEATKPRFLNRAVCMMQLVA